MLPLELSLLVLGASIPIASLLLKLTLNGVYLTQREFDDFRDETRRRFDSVEEKIDKLLM